MLEVAFITDAPRVAGSEIWLLETLPLLPRFGIKPTVFLRNEPSLDELGLRLAHAGVACYRYKNLDDLANAGRFPIRVLQAWFPGTYSLLKRLPRPNVVYIHDQLEYHYPFGLKALYKQVYNLTKASKIRWASRILVGTQWAAQFLKQNFNLQADVVPVGVNHLRFRPAEPQERENLRKKFGFTRFTLLTPARFTLEKNHWSILRAARFTPQADFVLVGAGNLARLYSSLARCMGLTNVRFLKNRWDIADLYRASNAVLFPTLGDNPGLVILEGMASGIPVVTSPFPPQAEVISPREGLLIPPDPKRLSEAVRWLIAHPEEADVMGANGRARILRERTAQHSAEALAKLLHQTLE
jgi:glycosyltransferase involved in cell wall biosynthesis